MTIYYTHLHHYICVCILFDANKKFIILSLSLALPLSLSLSLSLSIYLSLCLSLSLSLSLSLPPSLSLSLSLYIYLNMDNASREQSLFSSTHDIVSHHWHDSVQPVLIVCRDVPDFCQLMSHKRDMTPLQSMYFLFIFTFRS